MADGSITIDTKINTDGVKTDLSKIKSIAKSGTKAIVGTIGAVTGAIIAAGAAATKFGSDYETSLSKVSTLFGDVKVNTDGLTKKIISLSNSTGETASSLNEGLYQALSAGVKVTEDMTTATEFLETSVKLAKGGFTTTEGSVDLLTTAINAYGMEAKDANRISDILIMTQNKGKTTIDELSGSLGRVLPTASAYNVQLEDVSTSMALMTAGGIKTAEASTYLKSMLNELAKEGSNVSDTLKSKTGKSFSNLMKDGYTLGDVMKVLGESVDNNATAFSNLWSSQEAGTGALTILNNGTQKYNDTLKEISQTAGATEIAYTKMADTFETQFSRAKEGVKNLGIQIYNTLIKDAGKNMLGVANEYISQLSNAFEQNGATGLIEALGKILSDLVTKASENAPKIINMAINFIQTFIKGITQNLPIIIQGILKVANSIINALLDMLPELLQLGLQVILQLAMRDSTGFTRLNT